MRDTNKTTSKLSEEEALSVALLKLEQLSVTISERRSKHFNIFAITFCIMMYVMLILLSQIRDRIERVGNDMQHVQWRHNCATPK